MFASLCPFMRNRSHKHRIESDHFITTLDLDFVRGAPASDYATDQGLAVWFTAGNVSDSFVKAVKEAKDHDWRPALSSAGFGLNGIVPSSFHGVGVVFSFPGTVSLVWSDGSKQIDLKAKSVSNFDFRKEGIKLTLSISRKSGHVSCYLHDAAKGKGLLEANVSDIPRAGFFGFTAFSGSSGNPDRVLLREMRSLNLDMKAGTGEEEPKSELDQRLEKKHLSMNDLIDHNGEEEDWLVSDPVHQVQDVNKAISILSEYLADTRYRDASLSRTLADVQSRAETLEESINDLRMEIKLSFKTGSGGSSGVKLAEEIKGLTDLIHMHSEESKSFEGLKNRLKELNDDQSRGGGGEHGHVFDKLLKSNAELESEVVNANFTANAVIAVFGIVVLLIGLLLYRNMRQYEKKHFL